MENAGIFYGHLEYFMVIWNILWSFGIFYGHLEYFMVIWYILWPFGYAVVIWYIPRFDLLRQEKSGSPALHSGPICIQTQPKAFQNKLLFCMFTVRLPKPGR
jgi:hypothetical protein